MIQERWSSNRAWFLVLPVVAVVAANALIPLMTVVNYSVQYVRGKRSVFKGLDNYLKVLEIQPATYTADVQPALFFSLLGIQCLVGTGLVRVLRSRGWSGAACIQITLMCLLSVVVVDQAFCAGVSWAWVLALAAIMVPTTCLLGLASWGGWRAALAFCIAFPLLLPFALNWPFLHQACFSLLALGIEVPLGIAIALCLPRKGLAASLSMVAVAVPLLIPLAVIGFIWRVFTDPGVGLFGKTVIGMGWEYNPVTNWFDSWFTIILMDVWHWTSLVVLLVFAGLRAIPPAWYQAAEIDGASRWAIFRYVELPKLRSVLVIAVLLRFMDSFMVFTEPYLLNSGGPGSSTEMLSTKLYLLGDQSPTSGKAAAFSILYLLYVLFFSYLLYNALMRLGKERAASTS